MRVYCVLSVLISSVSLVTACPPPESLHPCFCTGNPGHERITCHGLEDDRSLQTVVRALARDMSEFNSLVIEKGNFTTIPHDIFKGIKFREFQMSYTSFVSLTDTDDAFEGLEKDLTALTLFSSPALKKWDWSVFRNFKALKELSVAGVGSGIAAKNIEKINASIVEKVAFSNNKLTRIGDRAFAKFKRLRSMLLTYNLISKVKRSMLPKPASSLRILRLSDNRIEELPHDMFVDMPQLSFLDLDANKLLTLNENTFTSVWTQLTHFYAQGNPLRCDWRLTWILEMRFPTDRMEAYCNTPARLKGRSLQRLRKTDLWDPTFYANGKKVV